MHVTNITVPRIQCASMAKESIKPSHNQQSTIPTRVERDEHKLDKEWKTMNDSLMMMKNAVKQKKKNQ